MSTEHLKDLLAIFFRMVENGDAPKKQVLFGFLVFSPLHPLTLFFILVPSSSSL
jgi:hypothetical protein